MQEFLYKELPNNWDELMKNLGYKPLNNYYVKVTSPILNIQPTVKQDNIQNKKITKIQIIKHHDVRVLNNTEKSDNKQDNQIKIKIYVIIQTTQVKGDTTIHQLILQAKRGVLLPNSIEKFGSKETKI